MKILYHPRNKCNINYTISNVDLVAGTVNYKIISGNLPIKVELIGSTTYMNNHASYGTYQFTGIANESYDFKITDHRNCTKQESIAQCDSCPEGYNSVGGKCEKITEVTPTYYPTTYTLSGGSKNSEYCRYGAYIFSRWNFNGTGDYEQVGVTPLNTYWTNSPRGNTLGPLNRIGVWASTVRSDQIIGFSFCFNLEKGKILYVAFSVDNSGILKLNGEEIIHQDYYAMIGILHTDCYQAWFIYPIYIPSGENIIEIIGKNDPGGATNPAAIGAAIYDATKAELIAAHSDADLAGKILWQSSSMIGKPLSYEYTPTYSYHGYVCPTGYALKDCGGAIVCQLKETIDCPE